VNLSIDEFILLILIKEGGLVKFHLKIPDKFGLGESNFQVALQ